MGMFGGASNQSQSDFKKGLNKVYTWYTGGFIAFVLVLAVLEQMGMSRAWIGYLFLAATVLLYAGIGMSHCRGSGLGQSRHCRAAS